LISIYQFNNLVTVSFGYTAINSKQKGSSDPHKSKKSAKSPEDLGFCCTFFI